MSNNIVEMYYTKEKTKKFLTEAYEFNPTKKFVWLQRLLWKALFKLGALRPYWDEKITHHQKININRETVARNLLEAYSKCFPSRKQPSHVYMGHRQFEELAMERLEHHLVGFEFSVALNGQRTVFDLPITVVPHMDGVLIV